MNLRLDHYRNPVALGDRWVRKCSVVNRATARRSSCRLDLREGVELGVGEQRCAVNRVELSCLFVFFKPLT